MVIPNEQLEIWSHQGAIQSSQNTHISIRNCIGNYSFPENVLYDIYLQGSYKNSTNIYANSDVDVIVQLNSSFRRNISKLNEEEKEIFHRNYPDATYHWSDFRSDVLNALINYYEQTNITEGNKSIKLEGYSGRLNADIVVAIQYRYFWHVYENNSDVYTEGIAFWARNDGTWFYSYPKQHYENGILKMRNTNNNYKSIIRIYKNIKGRLENNVEIPDSFISSYYIESLLYNVPNSLFSGSYYDMIYNSLKWLNENDFDDFLCQHELYKLFGTSIDQWSISDAKDFINSVIIFWNEW